MDPNEALRRAFEDGDQDALEALRGWLASGGFAPTIWVASTETGRAVHRTTTVGGERTLCGRETSVWHNRKSGPPCRQCSNWKGLEVWRWPRGDAKPLGTRVTP